MGVGGRQLQRQRLPLCPWTDSWWPLFMFTSPFSSVKAFRIKPYLVHFCFSGTKSEPGRRLAICERSLIGRKTGLVRFAHFCGVNTSTVAYSKLTNLSYCMWNWKEMHTTNWLSGARMSSSVSLTERTLFKRKLRFRNLPKFTQSAGGSVETQT